MKITRKQLRNLIKEELSRALLNEDSHEGAMRFGVSGRVARATRTWRQDVPKELKDSLKKLHRSSRGSRLLREMIGSIIEAMKGSVADDYPRLMLLVAQDKNISTITLHHGGHYQIFDEIYQYFYEEVIIDNKIVYGHLESNIMNYGGKRL